MIASIFSIAELIDTPVSKLFLLVSIVSLFFAFGYSPGAFKRPRKKDNKRSVAGSPEVLG